MPVHDLGYRAWTGRLQPRLLRWWAIADTGIRLAWRGRWLRRMLLVAWLPALYMGAAFLFYEQWMGQMDRQDVVIAEALQLLQQAGEEFDPDSTPEELLTQARETVAEGASVVIEQQARHLAMAQTRDQLSNVLPGFPVVEDRHMVWAWLLMIFFRHPQGLLMLLVVGLVSPPLISGDMGSRAFLLYFSRPVTRLDYICGKLAVVWAYVLMITTVPALSLYVVGVLMSPSLGVVGDTWDLPLRIVGASALLLIPTTTMALAISSLTSRTWQASFAWFAVWILGYAAYYSIYAGLSGDISPYWTSISLYHTLGRAQSWAFGLEPGSNELASSIALLALITFASLGIMFRRISSPMRI